MPRRRLTPSILLVATLCASRAALAGECAGLELPDSVEAGLLGAPCV